MAHDATATGTRHSARVTEAMRASGDETAAVPGVSLASGGVTAAAPVMTQASGGATAAAPVMIKASDGARAAVAGAGVRGCETAVGAWVSGSSGECTVVV